MVEIKDTNEGTIDAIVKLRKKIKDANKLLSLRIQEVKRVQIEEKRMMTDEEINDILQSLPNVRSPIDDIAENAKKAIEQTIVFFLKQGHNKIYPSAIPELKKVTIYNYNISIMAAGQPVGILAAQAIAAQLMQATLNTFHKSGSSKNVSMGLKAYREILSASHELKNPMCDIYFNEMISFEDVIIKMRPELVDVTVTDIMTRDVEIKNIKEIYNKDEIFNINHYKLYEIFGEQYINTHNASLENFIRVIGSFVRLTLDFNMMYSHKITVHDVCEAILDENRDDIICVPSQILYVSKTTKKLYKENGINVYKSINTKVPFYYIDIYVNLSGAKEKIKKIIDRDNIDDYLIPMIYYRTTLIPRLQKIHIKGIEGIKKIYPEKLSVWSVVETEIRRKGDLWLLKLNKARMDNTGISVDNVKNLCIVVNMEIIELSSESSVKYGDEYILVKIPKEPADTKSMFNKSIWKPGKVVNYYRLKDLDDFDQYSEKTKKEKNKLIEEGKIDEAESLKMSRPRSEFEISLNFIYAVSDGSNLQDLNINDLIDHNKIVSNNVREIIKSYGVEAARSHIIQTLYDNVVMNDNYVDPRHVMVIADYMTQKGFLTPITLKGLKYQSTSTLTKAGYKVPKDIFHAAAVTGSKESLSATYASLMTGRKIRLGTGLPITSINPHKEKEFIHELEKEKSYQLDSETLAQTVERLEREANDEIISIDDIIEETYLQQDETGNVLIKLQSPSFVPPEQRIFNPLNSPELIPAIIPSDIISDVTNEISESIIDITQ